MARTDRADSTRDTEEHIPLVTTTADERLQAVCLTIANGMGISRDG
jgi:hypothetical protein